VEHIWSRKSRADENSHEIYIEIMSSGNDVVKRLKDGMRNDVIVSAVTSSQRSDVIVHVISSVAAPVVAVTSAPAASDGATSVRHNVSLDRTDTQCTTTIQSHNQSS